MRDVILWHENHAALMCHAVLAAVSSCYPPRIGRLLTRYSPVRHSVISLPPRRTSQKCFVRLECVKHAASVHPEPGSNSLKICISSDIVSSARWYLFQSAILASYLLKVLCFQSFINEILIRSFVVVQFPRTKPSGLSPPRSGSIILSHLPSPCQPPFEKFLLFFWFVCIIYLFRPKWIKDIPLFSRQKRLLQIFSDLSRFF